MTSGTQKNLLQEWFPHTAKPFIANAPMLGFTDVRMANAVTRAGSLGFVGGGFDFRPESIQLADLDANLAKAGSELKEIHEDDKDLPIGVGFITLTPKGFENAVAILQKHRVAAVWLSFPQSDSDHLSLIDNLRKAKEASPCDWNLKIFVQVGTVEAAKVAMEQGADVLVVQGTDAGGHQWAQGASLMSLLPEIRDTRDSDSRFGNVAIVGAGGIVDGRGCLAALGLGAEGVVMGTRFVATAECPAPEEIKQVIVHAKDGATSTVKSVQHDVYQSTDVFPRQYDGRAVIGLSYTDFQGGIADDEIIRRYNEARQKGENHRRTVWAGASVGVIHSVVTVEDLIKSIRAEMKSALTKLMGNI
ncbi:Aldolase-type TIM barrel [Penicillium argentinense]|uniref:Aldolase-type TIM barrel n=1 Tax=Penicillium argentinense TaxID=1131581 RepID=A0A9W9EYT1_9EURO|nr:Aldolase-type TIM barrel [Penicillium argentinense]KAJ5090351.1 Aldolase-type TIM barrel [Penicillium argentinense]